MTISQQKIRAHIFVSGRVQRVMFRDGAQRRSKKLGLTGWVKNLADGRVEAIIEGDEEKIKAMLVWLQRGPILAKVSRIETSEEEYMGEFQGFEIRY